jgi:hypothetical protein
VVGGTGQGSSNGDAELGNLSQVERGDLVGIPISDFGYEPG